MGFDAIKLAKETEKVVCSGKDRKYYRFRAARFYGGIATADCVGCNLRCIFCWSYNVVRNADKVGRFYSAKDVAGKLVEIAKKHGLNKLRISGNEPTICREHLIRVLEELNEQRDKRLFILETNGILLGADESYAAELGRFDFLHVRVSLKGDSEKRFEQITGADGRFFNYQLKALENLVKYGVSCHASVILAEDVDGLRKRLEKIDKSLGDVEVEELILYPDVKRRLKKAGLFDY